MRLIPPAGFRPVAFLSGTGNENPQGAAGHSVNTLFVNSPTAPQAYNGQNVSYMQYNQPIPRLYNWNVTVQRQLTGSMVASVGYVGAHGTNLLYNNDINQIPASELGRMTRRRVQWRELSPLSGVPGHQRIFDASHLGVPCVARLCCSATLPTA